MSRKTQSNIAPLLVTNTTRGGDKRTYLSKNEVLSLERTSIKLSGNQKIVYRDDKSVFIESITYGDTALSSLKGFKVNLNETYMHNLSRFFALYNESEMIWATDSIEQANNGSTLSGQYNNLTVRGARTCEYDSVADSYTMKRFFAPLYTYGKLPDRLLIFRTGDYDSSSVRFNELLNSSELVKSISIKPDTNFGKFLRTLTDDKNFPQSSFQQNYDDKIIQCNGLECLTGKLISKKCDFVGYLSNERTVTEFNNDITNLFQSCGLISPNLLNLEFMFEDPTAPTGFNSYIGIWVFEEEISEHRAKFIKLNHEKDCLIAIETGKDDDISLLKVIDRTGYEFNDTTKSYNQIVYNTTAHQASKQLPAICQIEVRTLPVVGTKLTISKNSEIIFNLDFSHDILKLTTLEDIAKYITDAINETEFDDAIYAVASERTITITNESYSDDVEDVVVSVPNSLQKLTTRSSKGDFRRVGQSDIFLDDNSFTGQFDSVSIDDKIYEIVDKFIYRGQRVIRLSKSLRNSSGRIMVSFTRNVLSKYYILGLVEHVDFDMFNQTHHTDLLDEYSIDAIKYANSKNVVAVNWVCSDGANSSSEPIYLNSSFSFGVNNDLPVSSISISYSKPANISSNETADAQGIIDKLASDDYDPRNLLETASFANTRRISENQFLAFVDGVEYQLSGNFSGYRFYSIVLLNQQLDFSDPVVLVDNKKFKYAFLLICPNNTKSIAGSSSLNNRSLKSASIDVFNNSVYEDSDGDLRRELVANGENQTDTRYSWYKHLSDGTPIFRIGLPVGVDTNKIRRRGTFQWGLLSDDKAPSKYFIISLRARDIVEVSKSHLWCKDIELELYPSSALLKAIGGVENETVNLRSYEITGEYLRIGSNMYRVPFWEHFKSGKTVRSLKEDYFEIVKIGKDIQERFASTLPKNKTAVRDRSDVYCYHFAPVQSNTAQGATYGDLFSNSQLWSQVKEFSKNSHYLVLSDTELSFSIAKTIKEYLDINSIPYIISDHGTRTTTTINVHIPLHKSISLLTTIQRSLSTSNIERRPTPLYGNIVRYSGNYSPLFVSILKSGNLQTNPYIISTAGLGASDIDSYINESGLYGINGMNRLGQILVLDKVGTSGTRYISTKFFKSDSTGSGIANILLESVSPNSEFNRRNVNQLVIADNREVYVWSNDLKTLKPIVKISDFRNANVVQIVFDGAKIPEKLNDTTQAKIISTISGDSKITLVQKKHITNPTSDRIYEVDRNGNRYSQYPNISFNEIPGFVSSCFSYPGEFVVKTIYNKSIDIIALIKYVVGLSFNKNYQHITKNSDWNEVYQGLSFYYSHLTPDNIQWNNVYDLMFERFFLEFFSIKYHIESVENEAGNKLDFINTSVSTIRINDKNLLSHDGTTISITFRKK